VVNIVRTNRKRDDEGSSPTSAEKRVGTVLPLVYDTMINPHVEAEPLASSPENHLQNAWPSEKRHPSMKSTTTQQSSNAMHVVV
jgi:hypothetical protein